jgi:hypothetical protein
MATLTTAEVLEMLATATGLVAQLSTIVPELVANYDTVKTALSSSDAAALDAQIVQVHSDVQSLAAQIDALK